ncbi:unnamed protein product [Cochlearia groenlandica]
MTVVRITGFKEDVLADNGVGSAAMRTICSLTRISLYLPNRFIMSWPSWFYCLSLSINRMDDADVPKLGCNGKTFPLGYPHGLERGWSVLTLRSKFHET